MLRISLLLFFSCFLVQSTMAWGFWAHQRINRLAVFSLPTEMFGFYKTHIEYLTEHAVDPDKRRYVVEGEAPKHYIDLDHFCVYPCDSFPRKWQDAKAQFSEDTLMAYGMVPWSIEWTMNKLVDAFVAQDVTLILKHSADLGHYIADSHVPLHTTENYNGQLTDQYGIHGFWESRLPELFNEEYSFWVGGAKYIKDGNAFIWMNILSAHSMLDKVLASEKALNEHFPSDEKYTLVKRGETYIKTYSEAYALAYHEALDGMVEKQMQASIKHVADLWFTCWVRAGMPDLNKLQKAASNTPEELAEEKVGVEIKSRSHAATGLDVIFDKD